MLQCSNLSLINSAIDPTLSFYYTTITPALSFNFSFSLTVSFRDLSTGRPSTPLPTSRARGTTAKTRLRIARPWETLLTPWTFSASVNRSVFHLSECWFYIWFHLCWKFEYAFFLFCFLLSIFFLFFFLVSYFVIFALLILHFLFCFTKSH